MTLPDSHLDSFCTSTDRILFPSTWPILTSRWSLRPKLRMVLHPERILDFRRASVRTRCDKMVERLLEFGHRRRRQKPLVGVLFIFVDDGWTNRPNHTGDGNCEVDLAIAFRSKLWR